MEKELKVINIPASGQKDWYGGAYCIAFVYSKYKGNFIVKGYRKEVKDYIESNYTHYFVNYTLWHHKTFRSIWSFCNEDFYIIQPDRKRTKPTKHNRNIPHYKWRVTNLSKDNTISLEFRRLPKRWVSEFDNLIS